MDYRNMMSLLLILCSGLLVVVSSSIIDLSCLDSSSSCGESSTKVSRDLKKTVTDMRTNFKSTQTSTSLESTEMSTSFTSTSATISPTSVTSFTEESPSTISSLTPVNTRTTTYRSTTDLEEGSKASVDPSGTTPEPSSISLAITQTDSHSGYSTDSSAIWRSDSRSSSLQDKQTATTRISGSVTTQLETSGTTFSSDSSTFSSTFDYTVLKQSSTIILSVDTSASTSWRISSDLDLSSSLQITPTATTSILDTSETETSVFSSGSSRKLTQSGTSSAWIEAVSSSTFDTSLTTTSTVESFFSTETSRSSAVFIDPSSSTEVFQPSSLNQSLAIDPTLSTPATTHSVTVSPLDITTTLEPQLNFIAPQANQRRIDTRAVICQMEWNAAYLDPTTDEYNMLATTISESMKATIGSSTFLGMTNITFTRRFDVCSGGTARRRRKRQGGTGIGLSTQSVFAGSDPSSPAALAGHVAAVLRQPDFLSSLNATIDPSSIVTSEETSQPSPTEDRGSMPLIVALVAVIGLLGLAFGTVVVWYCITRLKMYKRESEYSSGATEDDRDWGVRGATGFHRPSLSNWRYDGGFINQSATYPRVAVLPAATAAASAAITPVAAGGPGEPAVPLVDWSGLQQYPRSKKKKQEPQLHRKQTSYVKKPSGFYWVEHDEATNR